jgi:hypothetical protein
MSARFTSPAEVSFIIVAILVLMISCHEEPIRITPIKPEPTERKVLIEEFTGVRCVNCPQGTDEILNLQSIYGDNLIAVAIHAGFFAQKYNDSKFDFKTQEGQQLEEWMGAPLGYPSAVINRKKFQDEQNLQLVRQKWAGFIAAEVNTPPAVKITQEVTYDAVKRELSAKIILLAEQDIQQPVRLSVMLTEDNIIDPQADVAAPGGRATEYVHKHVLRAMLTNFDGNPLADSMDKEQVIERTFRYTLPHSDLPWWKPQDIKVVSFITSTSPQGPGEVLNAEQTSLMR